MWKPARRIWLILGAMLLIIAFSFLLLPGGNPLVTRDNYRKITPGMTQSEVEDLLGVATSVHSGHKAVWESMGHPPKLKEDDNSDLYESRVYVGRVTTERWHRDIVRLAFRRGDGVVAIELFEEYSPTQPQRIIEWIRIKCGQQVTVGQFH